MLISGVSVAFAIFFGICSKQRNDKKDTQEETERRAENDTMVVARVISFEAFSMMVDEALERMKKMLESNKAMQTLVSGEAGETVEKDM